MGVYYAWKRFAYQLPHQGSVLWDAEGLSEGDTPMKKRQLWVTVVGVATFLVTGVKAETVL